MRAYINVWGRKYLTESISWFDTGEISLVGFVDEKNEYRVIHNIIAISDLENVNEVEHRNTMPLIADLEKRITWEES